MRFMSLRAGTMMSRSFFLRSAFPDESVRDSCRSSLAILVGGDDERAAAVRRALTDPVEFSRQVEDAQE